MKRLSLILICLAGSAFAEAEPLSDRQKAALERVQPVIASEVPGAAGETLAECIVRVAKRRELRKLSKADVGGDTLDPTVVEISNEIMVRQEFTTCVTEALAAK